VLHIAQLAVEDECFSSCVHLNEVHLGLLGAFLNVPHGVEFLIVHTVVFGKLEDDGFLVAVKVRLDIVSGVDLAKGALSELFGDDEAVFNDESLHFLDNWDRSMLLAALHEDVLDSILGFHLI